ncbi:MAG: VWA domain-containing protein [Ignavibacteriae bacterium]|nr:VWA domain-containing protein [Ignavibacteriota bacterium]MCB9244521.1 VWA domain-containing protein [Ignavibacteriales bacterium]
MKKLIFLFAAVTSLFLCSGTTIANGVGVINAGTGVYLKLNSSQVNVSVQNQVAVITTSQTFFNQLPTDTVMSFAFPLPEGASATGLRWFVGGVWYQAAISPTPQDTTLPGGTTNQNLKTYLGNTPLFFHIPDRVKKDSTIIVELTYVQLLPYKFGDVNFSYPNDYHLIQSTILNTQELNFVLNSTRTIDSIRFLSTHPLTELTNNGNIATVKALLLESPANQDYKIKYSLNSSQLGLFDFSSNIPDTLLPDTLGGFFMFVAEPDPGASNDIIDKVFTLIVDRSGSMSGTKIIQARNAASFIMNNLNEGDKFNIVDYSDNVLSFRPTHVPYTNQSRDSALTYISTFIASGGTNISGAFSTAIPQFSTASDSTANIIIFFTDGQATIGITNTQQLVAHVNQLVQSTETEIFLYCFGIGTDANQQLLTLLSSNNKGLAEFLGNDELESRISEFYLLIRNPVLLNTQISFAPPGVITEVYPAPLSNLYIGQQLIVTGRYSNPGPVTVTLSGQAFNHNVNYNYNINLSHTAVGSYQFLTKIWAKQKIEHLLILYYSLNPNDPQAIALKQEIIQLSIAYGVISPFTSFGTITGITNEEGIEEVNIAGSYKLVGNYPNPFNPSTTIKFIVGKNISKIVNIKIYNVVGQLVKVLSINITGKGTYEVRWDGTLFDGLPAPSGLYFYVVDFGDEILSSKMVLVK